VTVKKNYVTKKLLTTTSGSGEFSLPIIFEVFVVPLFVKRWVLSSETLVWRTLT